MDILRKRKGILSDIPFMLLALGYFTVTLFLFYRQSIGYKGLYLSDMMPYIQEAQHINTGIPFPYQFMFKVIRFFMLFTSPPVATALTVALLNLLTVFVLKYFLEIQLQSVPLFCSSNLSKTQENWLHSFVIDLSVFAILFVTSLYCPLLSKHIFMGNGTPNPYHNATYMATRPFTVISFFLAAELLLTCKNGKLHYGKLAVFSLVTALSTYTKPSYVFVFVPAYGLLLLFDLCQSKFSCFKNVMRIGLSFLPTFALLVFQYCSVFDRGASSGIGLGYNVVWSHYTDFWPKSVLLGIAFPLYVLLFHLKDLKTKFYYRLAWLMLACGLGEALLLYEKGDRLLHGNFDWGYYHGMFFVFVVSILIVLTQDKDKKLWYKLGAGALLTAHLAAGIYFFIRLLQGASYVDL